MAAPQPVDDENRALAELRASLAAMVATLPGQVNADYVIALIVWAVRLYRQQQKNRDEQLEHKLHAQSQMLQALRTPLSCLPLSISR